MADGGSGGGGAGGAVSRSLERLLEEAALSGELRLHARKLQRWPGPHPHLHQHLRDTTRADLSKNRFSEVPEEITTFLYLEKLLLSHNVIRHIPEGVGALQSLTYLDLSCNQLTELPREVCLMPLEVLLLSENRLMSLPKEIGKMTALAELDASHNKLVQIPMTIGDVTTLKALNLSNNQLGLLPLQITYLKLEWLDVSCNCISSLPLELRNMASLVTLTLDNNPLVSPPTTVCMRGRVHIFKYLENMANKDSIPSHRRVEDTRRGTKHTSYISSTPQVISGNATIDCLRHRTRNVDSGYSTSDGGDKRWSNDVAGEACGSAVGLLDGSAGSGRSTPSTPSTLSPGAALSRAHSLSSESPLTSNNGPRISPEGNLSNGDDKSKLGNQQTYRQYKEALRQQRQQDVYRPRTDQPSPDSSPSSQNQSPVHNLSQSTPHSPVANGHYSISNSSSLYSRSTSSNSTLNGSTTPNSPLLHSTPRRFQSNSQSNGNVEKEENKRPVQKVVPSRNVNKMYTNGNYEHQNGRISNTLPRSKSATSPDSDIYVKPTSPVKSPTYPNNVRTSIPSRRDVPTDVKLLTTAVAYVKGSNVKGPPGTGRITWSKEVPPDKLSFTMKREFDKQKEELDLLQQLRTIIESRLKMSLPEDLAPVLADGVVLCHLANHVRPRAVASVHVPSPAQPKLTMARCRRNVDNFLEACRRIGVEEDDICAPEHILSHHPDEMATLHGEQRDTAPLLRTLAVLLAHATTQHAKDFNCDEELHVQTDYVQYNEPQTDYVQCNEPEMDYVQYNELQGDYVQYNEPQVDYLPQLRDNQTFPKYEVNDYDETQYLQSGSTQESNNQRNNGFYGQYAESRSYHINYFQSKQTHRRYADDRLLSNFNNAICDSPIQEVDEYQLNGNNNEECTEEHRDGLKYRNNIYASERVRFVTPYYEKESRDQVDFPRETKDATRYVKEKMSLDIQDNLNRIQYEDKLILPKQDNVLTTCLCLGTFFLTAFLLFLFPL